MEDGKTEANGVDWVVFEHTRISTWRFGNGFSSRVYLSPFKSGGPIASGLEPRKCQLTCPRAFAHPVTPQPNHFFTQKQELCRLFRISMEVAIDDRDVSEVPFTASRLKKKCWIQGVPW